ncbi:hypothetical protein Taro_010072 [Colocasia esculenta]|uniref:DUF1279 domain-containing protein n=1 Tax=Colocasia esculenta TaxID=4460 RepID=A0A843U2N3_COLES|nr:hypothetical protein [Colocasia esculenta]
MAAALLSSAFPSSRAGALLRPPAQVDRAFRGLSLPCWLSPSPSSPLARRHRPSRAVQETEEADTARPSSSSSTAEEATEKYGLEFGLWKVFSSKEGGDGGGKGKSKTDQAKELLAKYGGAYLATSITLSLISFSLCYVLVSAGIDVQALLQKVGISTNEAGEKVGTFALAYAAHKAASPIRFPPTVALTPIVASWIGKKLSVKTKAALIFLGIVFLVADRSPCRHASSTPPSLFALKNLAQVVQSQPIYLCAVFDGKAGQWMGVPVNVSRALAPRPT